MVGSGKKTVFIFNNFVIFIIFIIRNFKSWGLNLNKLQLVFIHVWKSKLANQTNRLLLSPHGHYRLLLSPLQWNRWSYRSLLVTWSAGLLMSSLAMSQYLRIGFATKYVYNYIIHNINFYHTILSYNFII